MLQGYVPYKTAFKLGGEAVDDDKRVNSKAAKSLSSLDGFTRDQCHPKGTIFIQHFHHNVANLFNGQAKAMIVTSSRPAAARYKLPGKYIEDNPEYSAYRVLVAFFGKLTGKQI